MTLTALPDTYTTTRHELQRVATLGDDQLLASADLIADDRAFLLRGVELLRVASGTYV